ncbi:uncharacterized protein LOC128849388 isoform X2 [Cuculus canorus]|uniref:uncharacterized protein LOC128849388 isoform X2 n=1 Tax=Cuculus canorus TaxID=55661 RepID=UPI0023AB53F9|nr:uncharacterized protein LOC128849388 isoform X2 [Cuculus canorus]
MEWFESEGTSKPIQSHPCHGQGHLLLAQGLQTPSNLAWNPSRDGAAPLLWATWARASPPSQENISPQDLISISPLAAQSLPPHPIPALCDPEPLPSFPGAPFSAGSCSKVSWSLLSFRLNNPNSLSLASYGRFSSPGIISVVSSGLTPTAPCPPCAQDSRTGLRTPEEEPGHQNNTQHDDIPDPTGDPTTSTEAVDQLTAWPTLPWTTHSISTAAVTQAGATGNKTEHAAAVPIRYWSPVIFVLLALLVLFFTYRRTKGEGSRDQAAPDSSSSDLGALDHLPIQDTTPIVPVPQEERKGSEKPSTSAYTETTFCEPDPSPPPPPPQVFHPRAPAPGVPPAEPQPTPGMVCMSSAPNFLPPSLSPTAAPACSEEPRAD